jgi:DNA-binding NarL/FixJ family response regulator/REP element-mobilizing transposase RayT
MQTHILIINRQLNFAVSIKQALERTGNFEVHPFTSPDPALDYLRGHMQDVALIDFTLPGISGSEVVEKIREIQPKIAIIATPRQPDELLTKLRIQGTVNTPFTARELIPVVNKAIEGRRTGRLASEQKRQRPGELTPKEAPGQTRKGMIGMIDEQEALRRVQTRPSESKPPDDLPEYTSIDNVLSTVAGTRAFPAPDVTPSPAEIPPEPIPEEIEDDFKTPPIEELLEGLPHKPATTLDDEAFSALLDELDSGEAVAAEADEFDELVNSMRDDAPHKPLPERHQQFVEFIVTGGMDNLLEEIERKKTDELPELDPTVFEKAAELDVEEPPTPPRPELPQLPQIEEQEADEGTVGDIFSGVSDTSFRNVLSILRGDEVVEEDDRARISEQDMRETFPQFFASSPTDIDEILSQIEQNAQREMVQTRDISFDFDEKPPDEINTAKLILEAALDENTPIDSFSISDLIANIDQQLPAHRPKVQPLPSWLKADKRRKEDDERFVREPDFLPTVLPEFLADVPAAELEVELPEPDFSEDWYDQTTRMSSAQQMEASPELMETEWLPAESVSEPDTEDLFDEDDFFSFPSTPTSKIAQDTGGDTKPIPLSDIQAAADAPTGDELLDYDADFERMAAFEIEPAEAPLTAQYIDDPYIAQLALSLTEVSLELTAEATLLTRDGEIAAYAGRMAREELAEMREAVGGDWDAKPDEARIRFINLEGSGKDYMLYSRRTVDDLTLSLVFSGTTALRDIRRQGKRLVEALQAVPETVEEPVDVSLEDLPPLAPIEDALARTPYAYVWIIRDPKAQLNNTVAQAIVSGMSVQLRERAWQIQAIHAKDEYVYLLAEVPGEIPPYEIVRDLKKRSAHIAHAQNPSLDPDSLWADSYLVVTPGRKLDDDEIQQFIQFERML